MNTPTKKSLELLRKEAYTVDIVEHWNAFAHIRQDLFGIIDLVAIRLDEPGVLGIQTTSMTNVSVRLKKASENAALFVWLKAGNRFEVHGWKLAGKKGERKFWQVVRQPLIKKEFLPLWTKTSEA